MTHSLLLLEKTRPSQPRVCVFIDVLRNSCVRERCRMSATDDVFEKRLDSLFVRFTDATSFRSHSLNESDVTAAADVASFPENESDLRALDVAIMSSSMQIQC